MISILVFPDRYVKGWPKVDDARAILAPTGDVLTQRFSTEVHFVAYAADLPRRHTIALFKDPANVGKVTIANVRMELFVADVDDPVAHENHTPARPEWQGEEEPKIAALLEAHPSGFVYETRGGYRLVYALPRPYALRSQASDDSWTAGYKAWLQYLRRRFKIEGDDACGDWTRFYRAPHQTRDGVVQELATVGDAYTLGLWAPTLTRADLVKVKPSAEMFGAVQPVPLGDLAGEYAAARIEAARRYLQEFAPRSIQGQHGRDVFFRVACVLVRRLRLPIDVAADCVDEFYNPQLTALGTTTWTGNELTNRLESARDTASEVPGGDVPDEDTWNAMNGIKEKG